MDLKTSVPYVPTYRDVCMYVRYAWFWVCSLFFYKDHYNREPKSKKRAKENNGPKVAPKCNSYCVFSIAICFIVRPLIHRLQGLPQANFNPKTYRIFIFHERRAFMPKMSQKRKKELSMFLNDAGRVEYNVLCRRCVHECKQPHKAVVVECRQPWRVKWRV